MASDRSTPSPPPGTCAHHSGLVERVRDLEGRATSAGGERREMRKEIVDLRLAHAQTTARWSAVIIAVQAVIAIGVAVAVKILVGG